MKLWSKIILSILMIVTLSLFNLVPCDNALAEDANQNDIDQPAEEKKILVLNIKYEKGKLFQRPDVEVFVDGFYIGIIKSGKNETIYLESSRKEHTLGLFLEGSHNKYQLIDFPHTTNICLNCVFKYEENKLNIIDFQVTDYNESNLPENQFINMDNSYDFTYGYVLTENHTKRGSWYTSRIFDIENEIYVNLHYSKGRDGEKYQASVYRLYVVGDEQRMYLTNDINENSSYFLIENGVLSEYKADGTLIESHEKSVRKYPISDFLIKSGFFEKYPTPDDIPADQFLTTHD